MNQVSQNGKEQEEMNLRYIKDPGMWEGSIVSLLKGQLYD